MQKLYLNRFKSTWLYVKTIIYKSTHIYKCKISLDVEIKQKNP
jgi:hypothetical protein